MALADPLIEPAGIPFAGPGRRLSPAWLKAHWFAAGVLTLLLAALALVAVFDLGPPLFSNDDWMYAWSAAQLGAGHGFHVFPLTAPLALPQVLWSTIVTLGHTDPRALRLSLLPFLVMAGFFLYRLARQAGARPAWSLVAAAALLTSPLFLVGGTSYMSDTPYIALVLASASTALAWLRQGRWSWACVLLVSAATLQRQSGVLLAPAIVVAFMATQGRASRMRDRILLLLLLVTSAACALGPAWLHVSNHTVADMAGLGGGLSSHGLPLVLLPGMLGLLLLPFALGLLARHPGEGSTAGVRRRLVVTFACLIVFVILTGVALRFGRGIFPGNGLSIGGFLSDRSLGDREFFPAWLFVVIEAAALTGFVVIFILGRRHWSLTGAEVAPGRLLLVGLAASQFLPLLFLSTYPFDRYFLVPAALLCPVAAGAVGRREPGRIVAGATLGLLAIGLGIYATGEQDYQSWQVARDQAARLAYRQVPPDRVQAGYVANAIYATLPLFQRTGELGWLTQGGPPDPRLVLRYAALNDPRPGFDFYSLRPGRIVLVKPDGF